MNKLLRLAAAAALATASTAASALTLLGQAPDPSLIVNRGAYEWVYASPCAGEEPSCGVVQEHHGFQIATNQQWLDSFTSLQDIIDAFITTPNGVLCASAYFSTYGDNCDTGDITSFGGIWHSPFANQQYTNAGAAETFLVRPTEAVPEPAMLGLFGLGAIGLGLVRRTRTGKR